MRRKTYRGVSYDPQNPEAFIEEAFRKSDIYSIDRDNKQLFDSNMFCHLFESFALVAFFSMPFVSLLFSALVNHIDGLLFSMIGVCGTMFSYGFIKFLRIKKRDKIQNALLQEHFEEIMEFLEEKERVLKSRVEDKRNRKKIIEIHRKELEELKKEDREFKVEKKNRKTLVSYS